MLPRPYRLKNQRDFLRAYKRGFSISCPALVLYCKPHNGRCRFGFSVSKKVGNAVTRNRVKRRLRNACYELRELFPSGCDYVCVARTAAAKSDYAALCAQLRQAANDAHRRRKAKSASPKKQPSPVKSEPTAETAE